MNNPTIARIGLISDTHMPERCFVFPPGLAAAFSEVDFILHAGDVGELWVLDQLSQIAPVFAVHGNDDTEDAQRELALHQVITLVGQRILLWHNHYPDRIDEMISRTDPLEPKLNRLVQRAKRAGAQIVVFGHWHLPLIHEQEGILLINPGTIELGNAVVRQLVQTVAILALKSNGQSVVKHIDLAHPEQPFVPQIDIAAGFKAAANQFTEPFRSPALVADAPRLREVFESLVPETVRLPFFKALNRAAHSVWLGERETVSHQDWITEIQAAEDISHDLRQQLVAAIKEGIG